MKKIVLHVVLLLTICSSFSQVEKNNDTVGIVYKSNVDEPLTKAELLKIKEVYADKTNQVVLDNPTVLKDIKSLLRNRLVIYQETDPLKQKKCKLLSEVPLNTTYNKSLKRDKSYNEASFNPLKYKLDFFEKGTYLYRIDNTDYFIKVISQYRKHY